MQQCAKKNKCSAEMTELCIRFFKIASFVPWIFRMMQNGFKKKPLDNLKVHHL